MNSLVRATGNEITVWGRNAVVGTTPWEELYGYDQALDWNAILAAAAKMDITSSSATDAAAGTGARKVRVVGMDDNFAFASEIIALNGQTIVTTVLAYRRIFAVDVTDVGSGGVNTGDIYLVKTGTGGAYTAGVPGTITSGTAKLLATYGSTQNGMFTTPALGTFQVQSLELSCRTQACTFAVFSRDLSAPGGVAQTIMVCEPFEVNVNAPVFIDYLSAAKKLWFGPKTDIMVRAFAAGASGIASATLSLRKAS